MIPGPVPGIVRGMFWKILERSLNVPEKVLGLCLEDSWNIADNYVAIQT